MTIALYRIDDRLVHGQVVVGWGQPLNLRFIVLVDDQVASSEWEQELYRMGVPPEMNLHFLSVGDAARVLPGYQESPETGLLLTGDIGTMRRLVHAVPTIREVNIGGIHFKSDRAQRLRYVYLTLDEEQALRELADTGVVVTAQDVPAARQVPLDELLEQRQPT